MTLRTHIAVLLLALGALSAAAGGVTLHAAFRSGLNASPFPNANHRFTVFVPDSYDPATPACLYVGLDGELCRASEVIDSLITAGKMPVTICVFLQPGVIEDDDGNVVRYNRSNEFDATTPEFADMLEMIIYQSLEAIPLPDGRQIRISRNGADHMIFGLSSGGIAAFVAAWHRPDLFQRVFSGVGTFVAMRGGNDLQAIVRKNEPKPLRVFLQDGTADVWNPLFGHWYEGNRMLASALDFAGYDTRYDWGEGGHNVNRATEIFAQVMEWMWRDWPQPIPTGHTQNDLLAALLPAEGSQWVLTGETASVSRPAQYSAVNATGQIIVTPSPTSNRLNQEIVYRGQKSMKQPFYWLHTLDNGLVNVGPMAFDSNGNLWVSTEWGIQICDQNGRVRGILSWPAPEFASKTVLPLALEIRQGSIRLTDSRSRVWTRTLNVKPAVKGVRPTSQGQG